MDIEVLISKFMRTFPIQAKERHPLSASVKEALIDLVENRARSSLCSPVPKCPAQAPALLLPSQNLFHRLCKLIVSSAHNFGNLVSLVMPSRAPTFRLEYACSLT